MQYDWRPADPVFIDLETQATVNLKAVGARAYLRHPDTRLLCLVAKHAKEIVVWAPRGRYPGNSLAISPSGCWPSGCARDGSIITLSDEPNPPQQLSDWAKLTFVAHNAPFDAEAYERFVDAPDPAWCDTVPLARASGLPGGLDALGRIFYGSGKDDAKELMKMMCNAKSKRGVVTYPIGTTAVWKRWLQYNVKDVLLLEAIFREVKDAGEPELLRVHSAINARGITVDVKLVRRLLDFWTEAEDEAVAEIKELTNGELTRTSLRSPQQMAKWLSGQGVKVASVNRSILERFYDFPEEFTEDEYDDDRHTHICEVLRLRQSVTRISKAKLQRVLEIVDTDSRVRDVLVAYGAHTGRFTGRNLQPHNFARGLPDLKLEPLIAASESLSIADVREAVGRCKNKPRLDDALTTILRCILCAAKDRTLGICDYASIEARVLAWLANDEASLASFTAGEDVYCKTASLIYGRQITKEHKIERNVGKVTELGCGYSLGHKKFGAYCMNNKLDLTAAGTTAEACVEVYRQAHPAIAGNLCGKYRRGGIWHDYQNAIMRCLRTGHSQRQGRCEFRVQCGHLYIVLPSGRVLTYRNCRVEQRIPAYAALYGLAMSPRDTIVYTHHRGYDATLYGGLITENIDQAVSRDILCDSLIATENAGLPIVLHVHDEIVTELEDAGQLYDLARIMVTGQPWSQGIPLAVEGFTCDHYTKSPWSYSLSAQEKS